MLIFEFQSNMINLGSTPSYTYSDMNSFGAALAASNWFNLYWGLFGVLFLVISGLIWVRGVTFGFKNRLKSAKKHLTPKYAFGLVTIILLWISSASFVYYNTQVLNKYKSSETVEDGQVKYERKYKKYQNIAQPKITSAKYVVDVFPEKRWLLAKSALILTNKSDQNIDSLHYTIDEDWNMKLHIKGAELVYNDKKLGYLIYKLKKPLAPNEQIGMVVETSYICQGFENRVSNTSVARNGTFINNFSVLPSLGYNQGYEINDKNDRKKHGLTPKIRMPKLEANCGANCSRNYLSDGAADWVDVETIISTSGDTSLTTNRQSSKSPSFF